MARASKPQSHGFSFQGFDKDHYRQTEGYVRAIDQLYMAAVADFARLAGSVKVDPSKPFDFASSPAFQAKAQKIVNTLAKSMTAVIQHGTQEQWLFACRKNDEFLAHIMDTTKVGKRQLNRMQDRNLDALDQFQRRKVDGLDLSQRVWKYAGQTKELMEMGIDIAVGDGRSAADLSRDLREYLVEPHKLFRRVRDRHGNLVLSQHAAQYHPGQGVYRSSYKNALRLASTEINMAYRDSDRYRWNNLDFVVGYRVHLSNNHTLNGEPFHDICDELAGDYPKDFIFKGWHPNCRCFVTPILQDPDEFNTDELNTLKSAFFGTELKKYPSRKTVTDVPPGFHAWVKAHREAAKGWRKQPYWIRDNFAGGTLEGGLKLVKPVIPKPKPTLADKEWKDLSDEEQMKIYEMFDDVMAEYAVNDVRKAARRYHVDISYLEELIHGFPQRHHDVNKIKSEFIRVSGDLDAVVAARMPDIEDLGGRVNLQNDAIRIWTTHGTFEVEVAKTFAAIRDERWPNLDWAKDTFNAMLDDAVRYVKDGKSRFASYQNDAMSVINKAKAAQIDASKLESLVNTTPTLSRKAPDLIREINDEMNRVEDAINNAHVNVNVGGMPADVEDIINQIHKANDVHELTSIMKKSGCIDETDFNITEGSFDAVRIGCAKIVEISSRFHLNKIGFNNVTFPRKSSGAAAHSNAREVEFNKSFFSGKSAGREKIRSWVEDLNGKYVDRCKHKIDQYNDAIKSYEDRLSQLDLTDKQGARWYRGIVSKMVKERDAIQRKLDSGLNRWTVDDNIEDFPATTMIHELGHTVADQLFGQINRTRFMKKNISLAEANDLEGRWNNLYRKHKDTGGWLSDYGLTDAHEFMAESMVLYILKKGKGLPDDVLNFMRELERFGKSK